MGVQVCRRGIRPTISALRSGAGSGATLQHLLDSDALGRVGTVRGRRRRLVSFPSLRGCHDSICHCSGREWHRGPVHGTDSVADLPALHEAGVLARRRFGKGARRSGWTSPPHPGINLLRQGFRTVPKQSLEPRWARSGKSRLTLPHDDSLQRFSVRLHHHQENFSAGPDAQFVERLSGVENDAQQRQRHIDPDRFPRNDLASTPPTAMLRHGGHP